VRFRIGIMAVGLASWSVCAWAQANGASSAADSYREQLKAEASGQQQSTASSDSREAYMDHLRKLSGEENASDMRSAESQNAADDGKSRNSQGEAASPSSAAETANSQPEEAKSSVQPVSMQTGTRSLSTSVLPPQVSPGSDCSDAYCQQLRRVASGAKPEVRLRAYEPGRTPTTEGNFVRNLALDQVHIWESPFKLRDTDSTWALPFGLVTSSLIATDRDVSKQLFKPAHIDTSKQISNLGLYSFIGAGAGFYGLGLISGDDHKRETGLLSGEAFINAALVGEALRGIVGRQRPYEADHFGHIGKGGSSFPSEHAIGSWAVASVIAHEYPNPFIQIASYGLASAISATRVTAGQHFPSDVLVGSAFGYLIGRKMYRDHHNPELGGSEYGTFVRERPRDAEHSGSAYVPLESWVYPVIDRLAALGVIHANFDSERPFTRLECARIAAEAAGNTTSSDVPAYVSAMVTSLQQEFAQESEVWAGDSDNKSAELESLYARVSQVSGPILHDGFHFGETFYDDYGRPYGQGLNSITGFSGRATSGPLVFYFRGEYQHAAGNPSYSQQVESAFLTADNFTPQLPGVFPSTNQFRVLDAYLGVNFAGNQLTLGQQSLWWGPGEAGPLMLSNNSEPLNMIRLNSVSPIEIPGLSKFLGPFRYEAFLGQMDGYHFMFVAQDRQFLGPHLGTQPFIQGQRFTFKPTPNFEFGFSRTIVFGGTGFPLTSSYLFRTTFSTGNTEAGNPHKPGDRRSGVDFTYRIPGMRDWLSFYVDSYSDDEISPLFVPRRAAMHPGIYLAKLPKVHKVDLRVEGVYTDIPGFGFKGFFYSNETFRNGYTKNGQLLGSWIGREARGIFATSRLWLSPRNSLELGYRGATVDQEFLQGGHYQDFSAKANFVLKNNLDVSAVLGYENWNFPVLANTLQTNVTSSLQVTYTLPHDDQH